MPGPLLLFLAVLGRNALILAYQASLAILLYTLFIPSIVQEPLVEIVDKYIGLLVHNNLPEVSEFCH